MPLVLRYHINEGVPIQYGLSTTNMIVRGMVLGSSPEVTLELRDERGLSRYLFLEVNDKKIINDECKVALLRELIGEGHYTHNIGITLLLQATENVEIGERRRYD